MFSKSITTARTLCAFFYIPFISCSTALFAVETKNDSLSRQLSLREVQVKAQLNNRLRSALPSQIISAKEIQDLNANNVADAVKHMAGVTIKDYGGIGGLKTISVRGLSATHTGVSYDGLMMSDIQSGQIDLSQFCVENIESLTLDNGQPVNLLQSARIFAYSSVLSLTSKLVAYDPRRTLRGNVAFKVGSFGLIQPSFLLQKYFSRKLAVNLSMNATTAKGNYPFSFNINPYGKNIIHSTRYNTDVKNLRSEMNVIYHFSNSEIFRFKTNHYYSDRGLPGPVTAYNYTDAKGRMNDQNWLSQFYYENKKSNQWQFIFSGKYNSQQLKYSNASNNYSSLSDKKLLETYLQNEYYISSAVQYRPINRLTIAATTDYWFNNLFSASNLNYKPDAKPVRNTIMSNVSIKYVADQFTLGGNLLHVHAQGNTDTTSAEMHQNKLSPTFFASVQPFRNSNLIVRAFYKDVYRLPTFTELYYQDLGFKNLRPEKSHQYNAGITYQTNDISFLSNLVITADAYYNAVTDKITIIYGIPFSTVRNIGKVKVKGLDLSVQTSKDINPNNCIGLTANYSYQLGKNYDIYPETYGDILPYTPIHSGAATVTYSHRKLDIGYNLLFAGKRYSGQNSYKPNYLAPYVDQSIFGRFNFKSFSITAEVLNFMNENYAIVQNYPMPGRNYRASFNYKF